MNASHYSLSGEWRPQMHNPSPLAANLSSIFTIANCSACVDSIPTLSSFAFRRQEPKPTGNSLQNNLLIHAAWSKLQKFSSMDKLVHKTCCITSSNFSGQIEGFLFGGGGGGWKTHPPRISWLATSCKDRRRDLQEISQFSQNISISLPSRYLTTTICAQFPTYYVFAPYTACSFFHR